MEKQEKIVCAAIQIKYFDGYGRKSTEFLGVNYKYIKSDRVYEMYCEDYSFLSEIKGFITNENRFVDAKEAWRIAKDADQVNPLFFELDFGAHPELKPEDLY